MRISILAIVILIIGSLGYGYFQSDIWLESEPDIPNIPPVETVEGFLDYTLLDSETIDIYIKKPGENVQINEGYIYDPSRFKILRISKNIIVNFPQYTKKENNNIKIYSSSNNKYIDIYVDSKYLNLLEKENFDKIDELYERAVKDIFVVRVKGKQSRFPNNKFSNDTDLIKLIRFHKGKSKEHGTCNYELKKIFPHIYRVYKRGLDPSVDQQWLEDNHLGWKKCDNNEVPSFIVFDYESRIIGNGDCAFHDSKWCGFTLNNDQSKITYQFEISNLDKLMEVNAKISAFIEQATVKRQYSVQGGGVDG